MPVKFSMFLVCMLLLSHQPDTRAAEPRPSPDEQRIRVLVELLASKNKVSEVSPFPFPEDYDKNAQVVVYLAIQQLLAEGATAFDVLVGHLNDKRYCYTEALPDDNYNITVGEACRSIIYRSIDCYCDEIHYISNEQRKLATEFHDDLPGWWEKNRHRPLWQIQAEGIKRAIQFMDTVRYDEARLPFRLAEQLTPEVFESRRKENLRILKGMLASIVATEEAYRPKSLTKRHGEPFDAMLGLPWPTHPR